MTLSAPSLATWDRCDRRWIFEQHWRPRRWHPKSLFDKVLRGAILALSNGVDKAKVTLGAVTEFQRIAADPGLDLLTDPWTLAGDYCAMLRTIVEKVSRGTLLRLHAGHIVPLVNGSDGPVNDLNWQVTAFSDDSGTLHRWSTVESIDSDTVARELHSWGVFGDISVSDAPLTLHLVEIGTTRNGHRHSPWCRIYKHPAIPGRYKFRSVQGRKLAGGWEPKWLAAMRDFDISLWVDLMDQDGLQLVQHFQVKQPPVEAVERWKTQLAAQASQMNPNTDPFSILGRRGSCDWPTICPWQHVCFSPNPPKLSQFGDLGCTIAT